jgi:hypothetical protein
LVKGQQHIIREEGLLMQMRDTRQIEEKIEGWGVDKKRKVHTIVEFNPLSSSSSRRSIAA